MSNKNDNVSISFVCVFLGNISVCHYMGILYRCIYCHFIVQSF